jgi:ABC-type antimicrobial peptide transport system permease subunit
MRPFDEVRSSNRPCVVLRPLPYPDPDRLIAGVAASLALTRLQPAQLFNVKPSDPATMIAVTVFIACVAVIACDIPASRATRVDPMVVLRDE